MRRPVRPPSRSAPAKGGKGPRPASRPAPAKGRAPGKPPRSETRRPQPATGRSARGQVGPLRAPAEEKAPVWRPGRNARTVGVEAGQDLAHFVARRAGPELSIRKSRTLIERGAVRVNGQVETFHSRILVSGDVVEAFIPDEGEHTFDPERVLMDRDGVIAYDKPAWLPVVRPDRKGSWSLFDILRQRWPELIAVHRLDEDTSGIVLFARTRPLADRLEKAFKDHAVSKEYLALVRGHPREKGIHRSYLVMKAKTGGSERWESGRGQDAREAVTEWEVLSRVGTFASLVKIMPKTGRHHQIRIHFSEMGFPLYGDRRYGDRRDPVQVPRHMLHACRILLPHPAGGPAIDLTAPTPAEFGTAIGELRRR